MISISSTNRLFEKLYEFAKIDLKAANVLGENNLFPPAIYHYQQCFEKCNKSIIAAYLLLYDRKTPEKVESKLMEISHGVTKGTINVISVLMNFDKEIYIKKGGKETDSFIQNPYNAVQNLKEHLYEEEGLLTLYSGIVISTYDTAFLRLREKRYEDAKEAWWQYLRETFERKETAFLKYNTIAWIIFPLLEKMDVLTRYPLKSANYLNLNHLTTPTCKRACYLLGEMLNDSVNLVPLVWDRIKSMSSLKQ